MCVCYLCMCASNLPTIVCGNNNGRERENEVVLVGGFGI